jgi:hypothetical protein
MEEIIEEYVLAFDELNKGTIEFISEVETIENFDEKLNTAIDYILSYMIQAYVLGHEHSERMLDASAEVSTDAMYESIWLYIANENFEDRTRTHLQSGDMEALKLMIGDEYHRNYTQGAEDAAKDISKRYSVFKTWLTRMDNRVRDTHFYLEGMTVDINDKFYTYDGDSAYRPGGFEKAENNCGCRCLLMYSRL